MTCGDHVIGLDSDRKLRLQGPPAVTMTVEQTYENDDLAPKEAEKRLR